MSSSPEFIIVGRIRKAHGVRGDVVVETMTDEPDAIFAAGLRVFAGDTQGDIATPLQEIHAGTVRELNEGLLMHFNEIGDRNAAELWRGRYLLLPASEIPELDADELYLHELPGMRVELSDGAIVGTVDAWYELPHAVGIDVRRAPPREGETVMLLYDDKTVARVDRTSRVIVVTPPDGLLE